MCFILSEIHWYKLSWYFFIVTKYFQIYVSKWFRKNIILHPSPELNFYAFNLVVPLLTVIRYILSIHAKRNLLFLFEKDTIRIDKLKDGNFQLSEQATAYDFRAIIKDKVRELSHLNNYINIANNFVILIFNINDRYFQINCMFCIILYIA